MTDILREQSRNLEREGINFPVKLKGPSDIYLFERMNPEVGVNVFSYEGPSGVYPLRISKNDSPTNTVNLLLISSDNAQHYCPVKDNI